MPAAFYAISFKVTHSVLGLVSLELQSPPDQAAWDQLRDGLVGAAFPIGKAPLRFEREDLAVDRLAVTPASDAVTRPYIYQLAALRAGDVPVAGDGKEKKLLVATDNQGLWTENGTKVKVTLASAVTTNARAWLAFESMANLFESTVDPTGKFFEFDTLQAVNPKYEAMFLCAGVRALYHPSEP